MNNFLKILIALAVIGMIVATAIFAPAIKTPEEPASEPVTVEQQVRTYFDEHLSDISPEKEVLGGKFFITSLTVATSTASSSGYAEGHVSYEDGHNAFVATYRFALKSDGSLNDLRTFIQFPGGLPTKYIHAEAWPMTAETKEGPFSCAKEEQRVINGSTYCVSSVAEGAAGSTYTTYEYVTPKGSKILILTFILRSVQCANYNNPEKSECEAERKAFNLDAFVDGIVSKAFVI